MQAEEDAQVRRRCSAEDGQPRGWVATDLMPRRGSGFVLLLGVAMSAERGPDVHSESICTGSARLAKFDARIGHSQQAGCN
jgi:hypothetical protein